jgi:hypothetical protein
MIHPKNFQVKTLIGQRCPIHRESCILTPGKEFESQYPEQFEWLMLAWEEQGKELLEL